MRLNDWAPLNGKWLSALAGGLLIAAGATIILGRPRMMRSQGVGDAYEFLDVIAFVIITLGWMRARRALRK
jgi:hypothetical protein